MIKRFLSAGLVAVVAGMFCLVPVCLAGSAQTLYILPFNQGEAPAVVTTALFDALVERLYELGEQNGVQVTIVKQELTNDDADWFAGKHYLIGEVTSYNEDKGCCYTDLKLTGKIQLHSPEESKQPILELSDESFFNHDIMQLLAAQTDLSGRLGKEMADQLMLQIDIN